MPRKAPLLYRTLATFVPQILDRWLYLHVEGLENLPERGAVLAANHLSFLDSLVVPAHAGRPVYYLGKSDYFEKMRTRWFFDAVGVVPVHREGGSAGQASIDAGIEILRGGDFLGIYPEGTRSPDGRLYRGKTGPVRMALEAGVPVVPVAVIGTDVAMPTGARIPRRRPVTVRYGKPIDFSRYVDRKNDPVALRSATDELMFEIMMLSEQEYVDEYARLVKTSGVNVDVDLMDVRIPETKAS